jgi:3-methyladenine DNA glycosylase AlkD
MASSHDHDVDQGSGPAAKAGWIRDIHLELQFLADPVQATNLRRFFRTGPGQYGEGDQFLGIKVPVVRNIVLKFPDIVPDAAVELVRSPWHEERLCGLLLWVQTWTQSSRRSSNSANAEDTKARIIELFLANRVWINNWDLVDTATPPLLGEWLLVHPDSSLLKELVTSAVLWDRRIAVLSTFAGIRANRYDDCLGLCEVLLDDDHDLMHKACGWMLREIGKRDLAVLRGFLADHARVMPRTMLRYSIERMDDDERRSWMDR